MTVVGGLSLNLFIVAIFFIEVLKNWVQKDYFNKCFDKSCYSSLAKMSFFGINKDALTIWWKMGKARVSMENEVS